MSFLSLQSHTFIVESFDPLTNIRESILQQTMYTASTWPLKTANCSPSKFHKRRLLSKEALTMSLPFGENCRWFTGFWWPNSFLNGFSVRLGLHMMIVQSSDPETRVSSAFLLRVAYLAAAFLMTRGYLLHLVSIGQLNQSMVPIACSESMSKV